MEEQGGIVKQHWLSQIQVKKEESDFWKKNRFLIIFNIWNEEIFLESIVFSSSKYYNMLRIVFDRIKMKMEWLSDAFKCLWCDLPSWLVVCVPQTL